MDVMKGLGISRMAFYGHEWSEQTVDWTPVTRDVAEELHRLMATQEPVTIETGVCYVRNVDQRSRYGDDLSVRVTFLGGV